MKFFPFIYCRNGETGQYEGFVVDLAEEFSKRMPDSQYNILLVPDQRYGSFDPETQKWSGLIGYLVDGNADIAIADLTVTEERAAAIDFSRPIISTGVGIIYVQPETNNIPFNSLEELVNQDTVKYGVVRKGSTYQLFKNSEDPIFKKAYQYFEKNSDVLVDSIVEGYERVGNGNGNYAFISEVTLLKNWQKKYPQLVQIGGIIVPREFALALPKESQRLDRLNRILQEIEDDGTLAKIKERWLIKDN